MILIIQRPLQRLKNSPPAQIFEKSELAQELGAAIHIAPNCHSVLRRLGVYPENFLANPLNGVSNLASPPKERSGLD
jgi:hypothetical protein